MTGGTCTVPDCDQLIADAHVCATCAHRLAVALADAPDLLAELDLDVTRQARREKQPGGRSSSEPPIPFDVPAAIVRDALASTLDAHRRILAGDLLADPAPRPGPVCPPGCRHPSCQQSRASRHIPATNAARQALNGLAAPPMHGPACPPGNRCGHPSCARIRTNHPAPTGAAAVAVLLLELLADIRQHPGGGMCVDEVTAAVGASRDQVHGIDREGSILAGQCPECGRPVYTRESAATARCHDPECDGTVNALSWRENAIQTLDSEAMTAADAARALTALGHPIDAARIRQWASRGRLTPVWADHLRRPLYLLADVRALLTTNRKDAS